MSAFATSTAPKSAWHVEDAAVHQDGIAIAGHGHPDDRQLSLLDRVIPVPNR
jgi:hypothetical protein